MTRSTCNPYLLRRFAIANFDLRHYKTQEVDLAKGKEPGTHHVVPSNGGGWDVRRGGAERASGHFDTKREAVDRGRDISRNAGTEFTIHSQDGRIGQSDSHGNDPRKIKG